MAKPLGTSLDADSSGRIINLPVATTQAEPARVADVEMFDTFYANFAAAIAAARDAGARLRVLGNHTIAANTVVNCDVVIDGGSCSRLPTTVVDLTTGAPEIVREGRGDVSLFR